MSYKYCSDEKELAKVQAELNENPKMTAAQIMGLRRWIEAQPHIRFKTDDEFLLRFLRVTKFDQLKCQKMIDNFCSLRASPNGAIDWFTYPPVDSPDVQTMLKQGFILPLGQDANGRIVVLFRSGIWDPEKIDFLPMVQTMTMSFDLLYAKPEIQINGFVAIVDFEGFTTAQAQAWDKKSTAKLMLMQDSMPVRIMGIHYINTSVIVNGLFEIFKLFMTDEIKQMIFWHKDNYDALKTHIPSTILPKEYSGDGESLDTMIDKWCKEFLNGADELSSLSQFTVDESKRPSETADYLKEYIDKLSQIQ